MHLRLTIKVGVGSLERFVGVKRSHQMKEGASMKGFGSGVNDDFELKEGDTIIEVVGGVLSVHFYDKARGLIEKSMARSMIIKLLGREWNEFYLVKFQGERDYTKALIVGPWLVFGQYLTLLFLSWPLVIDDGDRRLRWPKKPKCPILLVSLPKPPTNLWGFGGHSHRRGLSLLEEGVLAHPRRPKTKH
ncbi:hypothetical protein Gotur_006612 [Gossypium turneri]